MKDKSTINYQIRQAQLSMEWLATTLLNNKVLMQDPEINVIAEAISNIKKVLYVDYGISTAISQPKKPAQSRKQLKTVKSNQRWTKSDNDNLQYLHDNGNSITAIAKQLGRSNRAISTRLWAINTNKFVNTILDLELPI